MCDMHPQCTAYQDASVSTSLEIKVVLTTELFVQIWISVTNFMISQHRRLELKGKQTKHIYITTYLFKASYTVDMISADPAVEVDSQ